MVKKELEKKIAKEKPVKIAKEKPVKEKAVREKLAFSEGELETLAKSIGLEYVQTDRRATLWTPAGIRVAKFMNGSVTITQPTKAVLKTTDRTVLKDALVAAMECVKDKVRHTPIPPKREKKVKTSPEDKQKVKLDKVKEPVAAKPVKKAAVPVKPAAPVKKVAPKAGN